MIKTIDLIAGVFADTDKKVAELKQKKESLTDKEYEKQLKQITLQSKKQIKQIEKQYPLNKELDKYLKD